MRPLILLALAAAAHAAEIALPDGALVIDVTKAPFNAVGDGIADDTAALQAAVVDAIGDARYQRFHAPPIIWLPAGTYKVTGTIDGRQGPADSDWRSGMILMGASRTGTVIRLADSCPGYGDAAAPKAVIRTCSDASSGSGPVEHNGDGGGNRAFKNSLLNLTVEVGAGNPGAIGIDFLASNRGAVEDVTVRAAAGSGATGIGMDRNWPGPALLRQVRIEGFAYGLAMRNHYSYSMTGELLELADQRTAGVLVENNTLALRAVSFTGTAPAIQAPGGNGMVTLLDSSIAASGPTSGAAITTGKRMLVRNLSCTGWGTVIDDQTPANADVAGVTHVGQFLAGRRCAANGEAIQPLGLPVEEVPEVAWPAATGVAVIGGYGDLQAALDGPATCIVINSREDTKNGYRWLDGTLRLKAGIGRKRILGSQAAIQRGGIPADAPTIRFEGGADDVMVIEHLQIQGRVEHVGSGTLVFKHCDFAGYATGNTGKTHLVDCIISGLDVAPGHRLWARQLNSEYAPNPLNVNRGKLWCFGYKTEGEIQLFRNDGALELFGGALLPNAHPPMGLAMIENRGRMSLNYSMGMSAPEQNPWHIQAREIDGSTTRDLVNTDIGYDGQALLVSSTGAAEADPDWGGSGTVVPGGSGDTGTGTSAADGGDGGGGGCGAGTLAFALLAAGSLAISGRPRR